MFVTLREMTWLTKDGLSLRELSLLVRDAVMRPVGRIHLGLSKGRIEKDRNGHK
jgi:hypothetical protein